MLLRYEQSRCLIPEFNTNKLVWIILSLSPPLRVGWPAGDGFEERDPVEAEVEQVHQTHAERSEEVKGFTYKMSTWKEKEKIDFLRESSTNLLSFLKAFTHTCTCPESGEGSEELTEQQLLGENLLDVLLALHRETLPTTEITSKPITS